MNEEEFVERVRYEYLEFSGWDNDPETLEERTRDLFRSLTSELLNFSDATIFIHHNLCLLGQIDLGDGILIKRGGPQWIFTLLNSVIAYGATPSDAVFNGVTALSRNANSIVHVINRVGENLGINASFEITMDGK